jgi:hypothetical protein
MTQKVWKFISAITEKWVKESYPSANPQNAWKVKDRLNEALEFIGLDAEAWFSLQQNREQ